MQIANGIRPRFIRPGDVLSCIAPAGIVDLVKLDRARRRLEAMGFRLKTYRDLGTSWRYLAGDDRERVNELHAAFADEETSAVLPARGGYGCARLLPHLDFELLRQHPKAFIGFSDNTVLHAALQRHCGWVTYHGPHVCDGFGADCGMSPIVRGSYWRALMGSVVPDALDKRIGEFAEARLDDLVHGQCVAYHPGIATGHLVGGNLALVCSLLGTPFEFHWPGAILLLEDIGEQPYRVDRFLSQLRLAGVFDKIAGVLLGQFTNCIDANDSSHTSVDSVLQDYFSNFGKPVLANYPAGHVADNVTLPLGAQVTIDCEVPHLTVLWPLPT